MKLGVAHDGFTRNETGCTTRRYINSLQNSVYVTKKIAVQGIRRSRYYSFPLMFFWYGKRFKFITMI